MPGGGPRTSLPIVSAALALLATACAAENPDKIPKQARTLADAGPMDENVYLEVEQPVALTPWDAIPLRGRGPGGGTLLIETANKQDVLNLGTTGEFCYDARLVPGENVIEFQAISAEGTYGEVLSVTVRQEGTPPDPTPDPGPGQVALGDRTAGATFYDSVDTDTGLYDLSVELLEGEFQQLVDGQVGEIVKFQGNWTYGFTDGEVLAFSLRDRVAIHGFRVTAPDQGGETCGPEAFDLWVSDKLQPELTLDGVTWFEVADVSASESTAKSKTYDLPIYFPGLQARYFAIRITDASCGNPFLLSNPTGLAEIRVIAELEDNGEEPDWNGAPSCASGF